VSSDLRLYVIAQPGASRGVLVQRHDSEDGWTTARTMTPADAVRFGRLLVEAARQAGASGAH
jgi:hypothetical protein